MRAEPGPWIGILATLFQVNIKRSASEEEMR